MKYGILTYVYMNFGEEMLDPGDAVIWTLAVQVLDRLILMPKSPPAR
jgi:hypothetical protein